MRLGLGLGINQQIKNASGGGSGSGLLDLYPGAAAAYSLRRLSDSYSGPAIRVQELGSLSEIDIGFDGSGNIDTTSLLSHIGSASGRVVVWYDQSGNGVNLSEFETRCPLIAVSGVILTDGTNPVVRFESASSKALSGATTFPTGDILMSCFKVMKQDAAAAGTGAVGITPGTFSSDRRVVAFGVESTTDFAARLQGGNTVFSTTNATDRSLYSSFHTSTNSDFSAFKDGTALSVGGSGTSKDLNIQEDSAFTMGFSGATAYDRSGTVQYADVDIQEVIWYLNDQLSNRAAIESNINAYWSIY